MAASDIVPVTGEWFEQTLDSVPPDLLRTMVCEMTQRMMDAEVEQTQPTAPSRRPRRARLPRPWLRRVPTRDTAATVRPRPPDIDRR